MGPTLAEAKALLLAVQRRVLAPEPLYLERTWASLVPYGLTGRALRDFLPVDANLNATSVRRDTLRVAGRLEAELGPEAVFLPAGCPAACDGLPMPPPPITVGLDGGYVRSSEHKQTLRRHPG